MPFGLLAHSGPYRGKLFPIGLQKSVVIGRSLDAHLTLPDAEVAVHHCELLLPAQPASKLAQLRVIDAGAELYVGEVPFREVLLKHGDRVRVGTSKFEFLAVDASQMPLLGFAVRVGAPCSLCSQPIPTVGGGRELLGFVCCWRCLDMRLSVKRTLGPYIMRRKIARHFAEVVYEVDDTTSTPYRRLALHMLRSDHQCTPSLVRRFLTTALHTATLRHEAFPQIASVICRPELTAWAEPRNNWPTFEELLRTKRGIGLVSALRATSTLCSAFRYARANGIVLGRIRADGYRISTAGELQVVSYWIEPEVEQALALEHNLSTEGLPRLPDGISEERKRYLVPSTADLAHHLDEAQNIRPLAAVLFGLACGKQLGSLALPELRRHLEMAYKNQRTTASPPHIPASVAKLLGRTLASNPANRYRTLSELERDLNATYRQAKGS